jgi:Fe2+ or Zn2+ uptake regulation protein
MLPCSIEEIIHAIKLYIKVVPQESKSTLRAVYTAINFFVDDELVGKINNIDWATANEEDRKIY